MVCVTSERSDELWDHHKKHDSKPNIPLIYLEMKSCLHGKQPRQRWSDDLEEMSLVSMLTNTSCLILQQQK